MKKRVKLLTTIASLCLAVALMAFGVYAASNPSFTATGSISFTSTQIDGEWEFVDAVVTGGTFATGEGVTGNKFEGTISNGTIAIPAVTVDTATTGNATASVVITAKFTLTAGSNAATLSGTGAAGQGATGITFSDGTGSAADTTPVTVSVTVNFSTAFSTSAGGSYTVTFAAIKA